jgi:hypothetical protein
MQRQIGAELVARLKTMNDANEQTCPYVVGRTTLHCSLTPFTLTDAEREAIGGAMVCVKQIGPAHLLSTLRGLLERTK